MKKTMRIIGMILAVIVLSLLVYLAAVLMTIGERKDYTPLADEPGMTETGRVVRDTDATALADAFGAQVIVFPQQEIISGETGNAIHAGRDCRTLLITFDNGFTVSAVRPASAAPLLHVDGMEVVMLRDASVCNLPAQIAHREDTWCAYFQSEAAAYRVTGTAESLQVWTEILAGMELITPEANDET